MTKSNRTEQLYGAGLADLRAEMYRYAQAAGHPLNEAYQIVCAVCGSSQFKLLTDSAGNGAAARCLSCPKCIYLQGSQAQLAAELEECSCDCGNRELKIMLGTSCPPNSKAVDWACVGAYCPSCGRIATYIDWAVG